MNIISDLKKSLRPYLSEIIEQLLPLKWNFYANMCKTCIILTTVI